MAPLFHLIAGLVIVSGAVDALAQGWPARPVRVIVPTAPGGNPDFIIRPLAARLGEQMKQSFVIDNRPGAAGIIGVDAVAKAAPDGYTILFGATGHVATPAALQPKLPFDPLRDLVPVSLVASAPFALFAHASLPVSTVKELVALAHAQPGKIPYASFGVGSFTHLVIEAFAVNAGVRLLHVPYKGSAPAQAALLSGEVMASLDGFQSTLQHVQSGKLRALAVGATRRVAGAPDVPTFAEAGYPGVIASAWFGLFMPAGTPVDLVTRLHAETVRALAFVEIREPLERAGFEPVGSTPEAFGELVRTEIATFTRTARSAGIRAE